MAGPTFTAEDALKTTAGLRAELGLGPEQFPISAFVGMISDEIRKLRQAGRSDDQIAALVSKLTGKQVSGSTITEHYGDDASDEPENPQYR
jgi:hypothetical protein